MKLCRASPRALVLALLLAPILLAACTTQDRPDGWAAPVAAELPSGQVIALVMSGRDRLAAIDPASDPASNPATGLPFWEFPARHQDNRFPGLDDEVRIGSFYGDPVLLGDDEVLIGAYRDGKVYAIRLDGSSARLIFDAEDRLVAGIVVDGRTAYIATTAQRVYAVDTDQPNQALWTYTGLRNDVWGTPALADSSTHGRLLIVPDLAGSIHALRTRDGEEVWRFTAEAGVAASPVVTDGRVLVGSFDRRLYALDVESGEEVWQSTGDNWFWGTPLVADGVVYAADLSGKLWAWRLSDGAVVWPTPYDAERKIRAQPQLTADGRHLVVITRGGHVHAIDRASGAGLWISQDDLPSRIFADPLASGEAFLVTNDKGTTFRVIVQNDNFAQLFPPPKEAAAAPAAAPGTSGGPR